MPNKPILLSIVIPCFNESVNIKPFHSKLTTILQQADINYELLYVNDGSSDDTLAQIIEVARTDKRLRLLDLSRNFGKETATSAGIFHAAGDAIIMIDADGQHPAELIPAFVTAWQAGNQVVIGVCDSNKKIGIIKSVGSRLFYKLINMTSETVLVPNATDYRLIDKTVKDSFVSLTERSRMTRSLIDWLGFRRTYIHFDAAPRMAGTPGYSFVKLVTLAINTFVSMSLKPLYLAIICGLVLVPVSVFLGLFCIIEMLIGDPLNLNITGSGYLGIILLNLVGILLIAQGITAIYLSHIHIETKNRPLYIIDKSRSIGI